MGLPSQFVGMKKLLTRVVEGAVHHLHRPQQPMTAAAVAVAAVAAAAVAVAVVVAAAAVVGFVAAAAVSEADAVERPVEAVAAAVVAVTAAVARADCAAICCYVCQRGRRRASLLCIQPAQPICVLSILSCPSGSVRCPVPAGTTKEQQVRLRRTKREVRNPMIARSNTPSTSTIERFLINKNYYRNRTRNRTRDPGGDLGCSDPPYRVCMPLRPLLRLLLLSSITNNK